MRRATSIIPYDHFLYDSADEVNSELIKQSMEKYVKNGGIVTYNFQKDYPIGKVVDYKFTDFGVEVAIEITEDYANAIEHRTTAGLSIGGSTKKGEKQVAEILQTSIVIPPNYAVGREPTDKLFRAIMCHSCNSLLRHDEQDISMYGIPICKKHKHEIETVYTEINIPYDDFYLWKPREVSDVLWLKKTNESDM